VTPGAGGEPAAEGGELEALREVPQGEPVRAQPALQHRAQGAALDPGGPAHRIDLEHAIERGQVHRQPGQVAAVLHAADDRAAAAEGHHDDAG
jgi:hypothetical protein